MSYLITTPSPQSAAPTRPIDSEAFPLWQQSLALEQGCSIFLRKARGRLPAREWERLADGLWPLRRQIAEAFRLDRRRTILQRLETARSTAADLGISLAALAQQSGLEAFADQLAGLAALADTCSRQLKGWAELLSEQERQNTALPPDAPTDAEAHWNNAFALLVQLQSPRPDRASSG